MSNRLTQIATRTGDDGTTGLGDGTRVPKNHLRVAAMGDVDELNSSLGVLLAEPLPDDVRGLLVVIQHELFNLGGELSIPGFELLKLEAVRALDEALAHYNASLPRLKEFILPAGTRSARAGARRPHRGAKRRALGGHPGGQRSGARRSRASTSIASATCCSCSPVCSTGPTSTGSAATTSTGRASAWPATPTESAADDEGAFGQPRHCGARGCALQSKFGSVPLLRRETSVQEVALVARVAGDEQLRRQLAERGVSHLDVDVRRAARVRHRADRAEAIDALRVADAAAEALEAVVDASAGASRVAVAAEGVALPDLDLGAVDGLSVGVEHPAEQVEPLAAGARPGLGRSGDPPRTVVRSASQSRLRARYAGDG